MEGDGGERRGKDGGAEPRGGGKRTPTPTANAPSKYARIHAAEERNSRQEREQSSILFSERRLQVRRHRLKRSAAAVGIRLAPKAARGFVVELQERLAERLAASASAMSAKETKKLDWMEVGQQKAVALSVKAEAKTWMANTIGKQDQVETKKMPSTHFMGPTLPPEATPTLLAPMPVPERPPPPPKQPEPSVDPYIAKLTGRGVERRRQAAGQSLQRVD